MTAMEKCTVQRVGGDGMISYFQMLSRERLANRW